MNARIIFSIYMLTMGMIVAFVPYRHNKPGQLSPSALLTRSQDNENIISVDKLARHIALEDSGIQIIDVRTRNDFNEASIPGSMNIPYPDLLNPEFEVYFDQQNLKTILYSNGEIQSSQAWTLLTAQGYKSLYILQGGLNEWYKTIIYSDFKGEKISARENALFEARFKARKLFYEMNTMPDSLKTKYMELKRKNKKKLDGGCG